MSASTPPLATKAPESDAQEPSLPAQSEPQSLFPHDSPAQTGPTMSTHCTTSRPTPTTQTPTGDLTTFTPSDIAVYISKPPDYPHSLSKLLLLLTPGTGVKSINNQLQADRFAREGFVVIMPDQFGGDPAPNSTTIPNPTEGGSGGGEEQQQQQRQSLIEQVKLRAAETAKSFMLDMWLARHTAEKVLPILHKVLGSAKDEFADAVANGGGVYAVGYCFGGKYVLMLGNEGEDPSLGLGGAKKKGGGDEDEDVEKGLVNEKAGVPVIKAGAVAHATLVTREDLTGVKVPVSLVCVENDQLFPEEILEDGKKHLQEHGVEHEIKTYPGVPHGFAVVGEYDDPKIEEAQNAAFEQMLSWLKSH